MVNDFQNYTQTNQAIKKHCQSNKKMNTRKKQKKMVDIQAQEIQ